MIRRVCLSVLVAALAAGCLESNPQPSPGQKDNGAHGGGLDVPALEDVTYAPPGADTIEGAEDTVIGGDVVEPGEDVVSPQDILPDAPPPMDVYDVWDVQETWDGYETWDSYETWDIGDGFETWDVYEVSDVFLGDVSIDVPVDMSDDIAPHEDTQLIGGGSSFGMCWGPCKTDLTVNGSAVHLVTSGWDETIFVDNTGALTPEGLEQSKTLAAALVGVSLQDVYGCPDCADGGAKYIALIREGVTSSHAYEFGAIPPDLEDADLFMFMVISDLAACTPSALVTPDPDCVPAA